MPAPVTAETGTMGLSSRKVPASSVRASSIAISSISSSTRSILLTTVRPALMPSSESIARCSRVCGITPSSAAMTSMTASMPAAPATIWRMNFSCPGTSTMLTVFPDGSVKGAKPSSIVMPRFFSSERRSQSTPVRRFTSVVLPWSMCPAVPITNGYSEKAIIIFSFRARAAVCPRAPQVSIFRRRGARCACGRAPCPRPRPL